MTNTIPLTPPRAADTSPPPLEPGEFHCHGDPVLEAILKHDTEADEASRRKALKDLYDEHARMVQHERSGAFLGDHTLWCSQEYLPDQQPQHKK